MTAGTVHPWMPEESINGSTNSATIEVGNSPLTIQELLHGHIVDDFLGVSTDWNKTMFCESCVFFLQSLK